MDELGINEMFYSVLQLLLLVTKNRRRMMKRSFHVKNHCAN